MWVFEEGDAMRTGGLFCGSSTNFFNLAKKAPSIPFLCAQAVGVGLRLLSICSSSSELLSCVRERAFTTSGFQIGFFTSTINLKAYNLHFSVNERFKASASRFRDGFSLEKSGNLLRPCKTVERKGCETPDFSASSTRGIFLES